MNDSSTEKLFSRADILVIENDAATNLNEYLNTIVGHGNSTEKSIITISAKNQLIFVEGNDDTGFEHLRNRHASFSFRNYWIQGENGNFKLDNPSKFHPQMMPIIHFTKIADDIFGTENKNEAKNKRPDIFDMYSGIATDLDGKNEKYHLLTYRDSKVVHTLFPDKKKHNRKSKFPLGKGIVKTSLAFPPGYNDLIIPYENEKGLPVFSVLLRKFYAEKIERWFIQEHDEKGEVKRSFHLYERNFEDFEKFDHEAVLSYQYRDLTDFEEWIKMIIEKKVGDDTD
jgi:hypothetical protein